MIPSINFSNRRDKSLYQALKTLHLTLHISKHLSVNTLWCSGGICSFTHVYPASISQATQVRHSPALPSFCTSACRSGGSCSVSAHFTCTHAGPVPILTSQCSLKSGQKLWCQQADLWQCLTRSWLLLSLPLLSLLLHFLSAAANFPAPFLLFSRLTTLFQKSLCNFLFTV